MSSVVGERGQVTIDKQIRDELGIGPGWRAVQRLVGQRVEITFVPPRHRRSLRGVLAGPPGPQTDEELAAATVRAWEAAVSETNR
jgi:bifunctional DNA-binding transcriptional regulator/antitoxin component of YhaV-PrlF toxin-antitoxin module